MNKSNQKFLSINYIDILSYIIVSFFLIAIISKFMYPKDFLLILDRYTFIPDSLLRLSSILIIFFEFGSIIMLISRDSRKYGAILSLLVLSAFTYFKGYHFINKTNAKCGCFSVVFNGEITNFDLILNFILLVMCVFIMTRLTTLKK